MLSRIKGFLKSCMIYGVRETIKSLVRMRIEKIKSIFFKDTLSYSTLTHSEDSIVKNLNYKLNYIEDNKNFELMSFGSGEKGRGFNMIKDKIKAKIRESILGVPVELEKPLAFYPNEYVSEIKELQQKIKELQNRIHELERENEFLRSESERIKETFEINYQEPVRCSNCRFTAVYPIFIRTPDSVKAVGMLCLFCKKFYGD